MTDSKVDVVMDRISSATPKSPIAAFKVGDYGVVKAVFASTVWSQEMIARGHGLIGIYDNTMDRLRVRRELNIASSPTDWVAKLNLTTSRLNSTRVG